ncbi:MAG: MlaD family protein [Synechococcus sp.]|nr:MlaD family protein [Synechococcus sp.]
MRRSVREAIVGFSIVGALVGFAGTMLWLRGVRLGSETWTVTANFADASGLAERSPVTYRGIVVGVVKEVSVTSASVKAVLELNDNTLKLPMPVMATVGSGSLLGGSAQVNLVSAGNSALITAATPGPKAQGCQPAQVLCAGGMIQGQDAASLDSVTATLQRLLSQVEDQKLVSSLVNSSKQFDAVAMEARTALRQLNVELKRASPAIDNLNQATAEAAQAATHIKNVSGALDNPQTVSELQQTVSNARSLTQRFDAVGGDLKKLTDDPQFLKSIRDVAVGLGAFFQELYPAQTGKP